MAARLLTVSTGAGRRGARSPNGCTQARSTGGESSRIQPLTTPRRTSYANTPSHVIRTPLSSITRPRPSSPHRYGTYPPPSARTRRPALRDTHPPDRAGLRAPWLPCPQAIPPASTVPPATRCRRPRDQADPDSRRAHRMRHRLPAPAPPRRPNPPSPQPRAELERRETLIRGRFRTEMS